MAANSKDEYDDLAAWVNTKLTEWLDARKTDYDAHWDQYERLWRARWSANDKNRESERSKLITPALQQAVEAAAAEIEETVFGAGDIFDIDFSGQVDPNAAAQTRSELLKDLHRGHSRKAVSEAVINSAVFGTGITELVLEEYERKVPGMQVKDGIQYNGVVTTKEVCVKWRSVNPRNFLIDPTATTVDDALGVAIVEYVGTHIIEKAQKEGVYRNVPVGEYRSDAAFEKDIIHTNNTMSGRCKLARYYGLVPRAKLLSLQEGEEVVELFQKKNEEGDMVDDHEYVEAVVVIANDSAVLKAEETPYMMKDRPVVAFPWDHCPGRFWGRGICEKGVHAQKALDAEVRSRLDNLALTTTPMMAMDANKLPRGFKFEVKPGKNILTQGNPAEAIMPFKFGQLDPNHWQNFANLKEMVYESTGTNEAGGRVPDGAKSGAVSMMLSGMIKRQKRTLFNFYDQYLMPGIQKTGWRYMQYDAERYPAGDYKFVPASMLGITAREYETSQLVQILQTVEAGSPQHNAIVAGIVQNSGLHNREQILAALNPQVTPEQEYLQQLNQQLQIETARAQLNKLNSETERNLAQAYAARMKPQTDAMEAAARASSPNEDQDFKQRVDVAKLALQEKAIDEKARDRESNERIVAVQTATDLHKTRVQAQRQTKAK